MIRCQKNFHKCYEIFDTLLLLLVHSFRRLQCILYPFLAWGCLCNIFALPDTSGTTVIQFGSCIVNLLKYHSFGLTCLLFFSFVCLQNITFGFIRVLTILIFSLCYTLYFPLTLIIFDYCSPCCHSLILIGRICKVCYFVV